MTRRSAVLALGAPRASPDERRRPAGSRADGGADLDGWTIVERLIEDMAGLQERIWLVIDDLDELRSDDALRQLSGL